MLRYFCRSRTSHSSLEPWRRRLDIAGLVRPVGTNGKTDVKQEVFGNYLGFDCRFHRLYENYTKNSKKERCGGGEQQS